MRKTIGSLVVMVWVGCAGSPSGGGATGGTGGRSGGSSSGKRANSATTSAAPTSAGSAGTGSGTGSGSGSGGRTSGGSGGDGTPLSFEEACVPISEGIAHAYQECQMCDAGCNVRSQTVPMCEAWFKNCDADAGDFMDIYGAGMCLEDLACFPGLTPEDFQYALYDCWTQFGNASAACLTAAMDEENDAGL